jgi:hypothetical protein
MDIPRDLTPHRVPSGLVDIAEPVFIKALGIDAAHVAAVPSGMNPSGLLVNAQLKITTRSSVHATRAVSPELEKPRASKEVREKVLMRSQVRIRGGRANEGAGAKA